VLTLVIGALFGDEGKGRVVHALAKDFAVVARATGGANASHTVWHRGTKHTLRQVPCGVFTCRGPALLACGMLVDPIALTGEIAHLARARVDVKRVKVSVNARVVTPLHALVEAAREERSLDDEDGHIGTTRQGIGPALVDKAMRDDLRVADLHDARVVRRAFDATLDRFRDVRPSARARAAMVRALTDAHTTLAPHLTDAREVVARALSRDRPVLVEGAQGTLLDVDHGAHPFVTATHPTAAGALASLGFGPRHVARTIGVARFYATRQSRGPLPRELSAVDERAFRMATGEHVLRVAWIDSALLARATELNGFDELIVTHLDRARALASLTLFSRAGRAVRFAPKGPAVVDARGLTPALDAFLARVARESGAPVLRISAAREGPLVVV